MAFLLGRKAGLHSAAAGPGLGNEGHRIANAGQAAKFHASDNGAGLD